MDRSRVHLILAVLCLVLAKVHGGQILFPEGSDLSETHSAISDAEAKQPESRGFWESDLFFLQKLSGIFGDSNKQEKRHTTRDGGLRPEHLPLQLAYPPNRRVGQGNQKSPPHRRVPVFRLPTPDPPLQDLSPPLNHLQQPSQNSLVRLPPPPPTHPSLPSTLPALPPPPSPPSSHINGVLLKSANNFPYQFVLPNVLTPPAVHTLQHAPVHAPVHAPPKIDFPPPTSKPVVTKPVKHKKPITFESSQDLFGSFTVTQKPLLILPGTPRPQLPQRPGPSLGQFPQVSHQHPRPAPQPQKQHPRPPPQPQRVVIQPEKPSTIHKKPINPGFNPSPQEGSMLADAFQPVFVASPSMDDLDNLDNDLMKPMTLISARSAVTSTTQSPPKLEDFF